MPTFLQISDFHLLSRPDGTLKGVPTWESAKLVLQRAREEVPDPDRIVLSGDLSHEHTVDGYELLRELLGDWSQRTLLIPGNHDDRGNLRTTFSQVPGSGEEDVTFCERVEDWQLIGLDSHVPGEVYGQLKESLLEQLSEWLDQSGDLPTLIFLHHPPTAVNSAWIDQFAVRNPEPLASILEGRRNVKGIFCGHIHQVFAGQFAGIPLRSAPAVAFQFLPNRAEMEFDPIAPGFRVIACEEQRYSTRVVRLDQAPFTARNE